MKINIAGDFYLSESIKAPENLIRNMIPLFNSTDFNVVNLEAPVTKSKKENRIVKVGPHMQCGENALDILKQLNVDLVTLANNHILDYGTDGLKDTFNSLKEYNINKVGAGYDLKGAKEHYILEIEDIKIAFANFAENEWASATAKGPGANPINIIDNVNSLKVLKKDFDIVICIIHGGHEFYHLPSPHMVKQYRFYAENGADIIVGHHPHCIGGYEIYKNVPIIYSLGTFLVTKKIKSIAWYYGLILKIEISKKKEISYELVPIKHNGNDFTLEIIKGQEKELAIKNINELSEIILDSKKLDLEWNKYIRSQKDFYLFSLSYLSLFSNRYLQAIFRKSKLFYLFLRKRNLILLLHNMNCEAHYNLTRDLLKETISPKSMKNNRNS